MDITIAGGGVAGLVTAVELTRRGAAVTVYERAARIGAGSCAWFAGGMIAPWCEAASGGAALIAPGREALDWWPHLGAGFAQRGTLVVAAARDAAELAHFARSATCFEWQDGAQIAALEPQLGGRFRRALFFAREAHLDPRVVLPALAAWLADHGGVIRFGEEAPSASDAAYRIDCRGFAARDALSTLRGVRGEMILIRSTEVAIFRPIRLLHPRFPLYVVPRGNGIYMIGATTIESDDGGPITLRSAMELLGAAYALHPAFAEAEIVDWGAHIRPAFPNNHPRIVATGRSIAINGLYRHGFLLAPAMAKEVAQMIYEKREAA